jgi:hypothetical protein
MMKLALIALKRPDVKIAAAKENGDWASLTSNNPLPKSTTTGIEVLSEGVFLIQLETALPTFGGLVAAAQKWGVPYRVHFFEEESQWIGTWESTLSPE